MSPEERQLLQGLFDRMRTNAAGPRDRDAEQMINDSIRQQPYAPYLLAQTVIVQDQALQAANDRLQQLEQQLHEQQSQPQGGGGFLSGLFGGGASSAPPPAPPQQPSSVWNRGGTFSQGGGYPQGGYAPPPQQGGPWGGGMGGGGFGGGAPQGGGGGFLSGALSTAAGVAGGVLMADSIRSLFSHGGAGSGLGIASGVPGMGGGETINNFFGGGTSSTDRQADSQQALAGSQGSPSGDASPQDAGLDQDDYGDGVDLDDYSNDV